MPQVLQPVRNIILTQKKLSYLSYSLEKQLDSSDSRQLYKWEAIVKIIWQKFQSLLKNFAWFLLVWMLHILPLSVSYCSYDWTTKQVL